MKVEPFGTSASVLYRECLRKYLSCSKPVLYYKNVLAVFQHILFANLLFWFQ
jgi:hypothetical protein